MCETSDISEIEFDNNINITNANSNSDNDYIILFTSKSNWSKTEMTFMIFI